MKHSTSPLTHMRLNSRLSRTDVARLSGVPYQKLSLIEYGKTDLTLDIAENIATVIKCDPKQLFAAMRTWRQTISPPKPRRERQMPKREYMPRAGAAGVLTVMTTLSVSLYDMRLLRDVAVARHINLHQLMRTLSAEAYRQTFGHDPMMPEDFQKICAKQ